MSEPADFKQYCNIVNKHGLHTRSAAAIVELANQYSCAITLATNKAEADAKDMIRLLLLEASKDTEVCVSASGEDAEQAVLSLVELIEAGFYE